MSMRKSTRQELRKSREILRFCLRGKICFFCNTPLITTKSYAKDGDGQGSPVRNITVHHKDGNHRNDAEKNKALCHDKKVKRGKKVICIGHRGFHMKLRWQNGQMKHGK